MRLFVILLIGLLTTTTMGCGSNQGAVDEPLRIALEDFKQFLEILPSDGVKPPKKMAEFLPLEPMAPVASEYLQKGEIVYLWGNGLKTDGTQIIAYQQGCETSGGWVLFENGQVKKLTSEDFSAADKAQSSKQDRK